MTPQFILKQSLCREAHCYHGKDRVRSAESEIECMNYSREYAEPGYTQPDKGILFANWNVFPTKVTDILERYGYSIEWSDEWSTCGNCNKAVRTSPDSYGWTPQYLIVNDCEIICHECLTDDDYLEYADNKPSRSVPASFDLTKHGYTQHNGEYANGFHPGQTDNPRAIFKQLREQYSHVIFQITDVGQFDVHFAAFVKNDEADGDEA